MTIESFADLKPRLEVCNLSGSVCLTAVFIFVEKKEGFFPNYSFDRCLVFTRVVPFRSCEHGEGAHIGMTLAVEDRI